MKDAQKPDHVSLSTLVHRLREGRYVIPDFQREFEWHPWDICALLRSIFLDYYIGSLLLWKGKPENFAALSCERLYGYEGTGNPEYIVLDGQQRLTAMYYAFFAPEKNLPNRASRFVYYVQVDKFCEDAHDDAFCYQQLTKRWAQVMASQEAQFDAHIFPLKVMGEEGWALPNWVQAYEKHWMQRANAAEAAGDSDAKAAAQRHADNAKRFGDHLQSLISQYQISYIELDKDISVDKVCDIFTQINSRGVRLDVFDLMNALLKPREVHLKSMWRDASARLEFVDTGKMNIYIIQVMSILRQGYCSPKYLYYLLPGHEKLIRDADGSLRKEVLVPTASDFEQRWQTAVDALEQAIKLLRHPQEFGAIKAEYLPYVSILPVFAALQKHLTTLPAGQRLDGQRKIRHWYWASVFTNRYSGSVESTSARDFQNVKSWLVADQEEPPLLEEFKARFKSLDLRKEVKRGTSVYNGIFNLLVLNGARDWMTGTVPQHDDLDDHHIVPASWGASKVGSLAHSILNRTPLTSETNRKVIGKKLPNVYLPELFSNSDEKAVRAILESHFISPTALEILLRNPFTPDDYEAFILERQRTLQDAIENLLIKARLDLTPQLRDLDEAIEKVELELRSSIAAAFAGDPKQVPSHVLQRVEERIQRATKKNAALDAARLQTLEGKLEYFDLREIQDSLTGKATWPQFEPQFSNKDALVVKFDQLAELRNSIRHSRSVDEITRKEGEAAILWFKQVLSK